jgi:hypothetical protein
VPVVRATGGLRDTVFDVDLDKARAAWELEGSSDWERDGLDATNGFAFEARARSPALDLLQLDPSCRHASGLLLKATLAVLESQLHARLLPCML